MSLSRNRIWHGCITVLILMILLLTTLIPTAKAAGETPMDLGVVEIKGSKSQGKFHLTPEKMEDLFDLDGSVYPGASWKRTVHVENEGHRKMEICIISCTTEDEDTTLFDVLETEVIVDGEVLYSGPYGAGSEEEPMTKMCSIKGGKSLDFEITVHLDESYGNALQGKEMTSLWEFYATYEEPDDPTDAQYTVYYVDEDGNELHEKKVGRAEIHSTVTEYAIDIAGYVPDAESKSIRIRGSSKQNIITFVYSPSEEDPVIPPDEPQSPESPQDPTNPAGIKTGVDLDEFGHMNSQLFLILLSIMLMCLVLAGFVTWRMIPIIKKKAIVSDREEDTKNE